MSATPPYGGPVTEHYDDDQEVGHMPRTRTHKTKTSTPATPGPQVDKQLRTEGIAPKAWLAALLPLLAGIVGVAIQWVATGEWSRAELATALSTGAASLLAFAGAYAGKPGTVTLKENGIQVARLSDERGELVLAVVLALALCVVCYLVVAWSTGSVILSVLAGVLGLVAGWVLGARQRV